MVVVGGITRLTESGLSITEWNPVSGAIPPLTHDQWEHAFSLYKATPEYREINGPAGMDLAAFKFIFFWEWVHRQLGRLIGLAFALPLLWFAVRRAIPQGYGWRLVGLLLLGGSQGVLGWYMVTSGLVGPDRRQPLPPVGAPPSCPVHHRRRLSGPRSISANSPGQANAAMRVSPD